MNTMSVEAGWALTKAICEIIDNEMAQSADQTWNWNNVAKKVVERIGPEASAMLDVDQAIVDAVYAEPVGTNLREDGAEEAAPTC